MATSQYGYQSGESIEGLGTDVVVVVVYRRLPSARRSPCLDREVPVKTPVSSRRIEGRAPN